MQVPRLDIYISHISIYNFISYRHTFEPGVENSLLRVRTLRQPRIQYLGLERRGIYC